jgi:hypothetical protein
LNATILFGITSILRALEQPTTLKHGMGKSGRKFNIVTQTFTPSSRLSRISRIQMKYIDCNFKQREHNDQDQGSTETSTVG